MNECHFLIVKNWWILIRNIMNVDFLIKKLLTIYHLTTTSVHFQMQFNIREKSPKSFTFKIFKMEKMSGF